MIGRILYIGKIWPKDDKCGLFQQKLWGCEFGAVAMVQPQNKVWLLHSLMIGRDFLALALPKSFYINKNFGPLLHHLYHA